MKTLIVKIGLCVLIPMLWTMAQAEEHTGQGTQATVKDRDKAEMNTSSFDPADLYAGETRHVAVFFDIRDGELVLSSRPAQVVRGNMAYKSKSGGELLVVAKDKEGEPLASYYMSDLRRVRVFEGKDREATFVKEAKDMIIRIPYDPRISQLTLRSSVKDEEEKTYDISPAMGKIYQARQ